MQNNSLSNIDFTYHVFSPKAWLEKSQPTEVQRAFETWLKVWTDTYKGRDFEVKAEEFIRHDLICAVMAGDEAAAVHCYSFFVLSSKPDVSTRYFQFFSPTFVTKMKQRDIHTVMSMEYEPTSVSNVSLKISVESGAYSILKLNSDTAKYESYADCDSLEVFLQKINHEIDLDFAS